MSKYTDRQKLNTYAWRRRHPKKWGDIQKKSAEKKKLKYHSDPKYRKMLNEKTMTSYRKTRMECIIHYGGDPPICVCCGESHIEFLVIDHINGGGSKHKKQWKSEGWGNLYNYLKAKEFPRGFRVLCDNCNNSLGRYGYCPHKGVPDVPTIRKFK